MLPRFVPTQTTGHNVTPQHLGEVIEAGLVAQRPIHIEHNVVCHRRDNRARGAVIVVLSCSRYSLGRLRSYPGTEEGVTLAERWMA